MNKVLLIVITATIIFGCGITDRKEGIKGRWELIDYKIDWSDTLKMTESEKRLKKNFLKVFEDQFERNKGKMFMTYKDSTYTEQSSGTGYESGDYYLKDDDSTIVHFIGPKEMHGASNDIIKTLTNNRLEILITSTRQTNIYKRVD